MPSVIIRRNKMKSKLIKAIISGLLVVGIGFGGFYGYKKYTGKTTTVAAAQYYTAAVKKMNLSETIQGTGAAYAASTKDVTPNNSGTLKNLNVKVGDTVTAGQTLFVADSDDVRRGVTTAKNNLTKQNLTLSSDESAEKVDDNKVSQDKIAVSEAKTSLATANENVGKMTVTAPIGGVVTAVNYSDGDSVQADKSILTIIDMSSMKIKISVDELDINKVQIGQKATIKFNAITDKSYEGAVESVAQTGTSSNNVTSYEVIVSIKDSTGIKLGMNADVTIQVESKENALVIPSEALIESNGQKYVLLEGTDTEAASGINGSQGSNGQASANGQSASDGQQAQNGNGQSRNNQSSSQTKTSNSTTTKSSTSIGKRVAIKTGLETTNYIEVTEGLTEGQKVIIQLPSSSSSTSNNKNSQRDMMGGFGGDMGGGTPPSGAPGGGQSGAPKN